MMDPPASFTHAYSHRVITAACLGVVLLSQACTKVELNNKFPPTDDPTVSAIIPNYGPPAGGTLIQITGTGMVPTMDVTIDGQPCTSVTFISKNAITCITPTHVLGSFDVVLYRPALETPGRGPASRSLAKSFTLSSGFTYAGALSNSPIYSISSGGVFTSGPGIRRRTSIAVIGGSVGQTGTGVRKVSGLIGVLSGR